MRAKGGRRGEVVPQGDQAGRKGGRGRMEERKAITEGRANARQVKDPSGKTIYSSFKEPQGTFSMTVEKPGKFLYCFSNEMSSYARKVLS